MPLGIPEGWYAIAQARQLGPGQLRSVQLAGGKWVLWRTAEGQAVLQEAYCPHLGADLCEGGVVVPQGMRCPFHGFVFDPDGACVATGYDTKPPPTARLHTAPVVEHHGLCFAWVGASTPTFPLEPSTLPGSWSPFRCRSWTLASHPQEISENSVDVGHFAWIHGYRDFRVLEPASMDGPELHARYGFLRP